MGKSNSGRSKNGSEISSRSDRRRKEDDESRRSRTEAESATTVSSSSRRKSSRRDDDYEQDDKYRPSITSSSTSRNPYSGEVAPSAASSYVTAYTNEPSEYRTPSTSVRDDDTRRDGNRDGRKETRRESKHSSRSERSRAVDDQDDYRNVGQQDSERSSRRKSGRSERNGTSRAFDEHEAALPQNQFPGEVPAQYTQPYRPPGLASDYYGDQGESVTYQPGVRPNAPSIIQTADQAHLIEPTTEPHPPPEPSSLGHAGASASFFGSVGGTSDSGSGLQSTPSKPGRPSKSKVSGQSNFGVSPRSSPGPSAHSAGPDRIGEMSSAAMAAGVGAAAEYYTGHIPVGSAAAQNASSESYGNSSRPSQPTASESNYYGPTAAAGLAGAAATAYLAGHNHSHTEHKPSHYTPRPETNFLPGQNQSAFPQMQQSHRQKRKGPLSKVVDWFRDPGAVAEYEQYSEAIGLCKHCFDPNSTPADAPRKHHYHRHRRLSGGRYGSSTRVDMINRHSSSDEDRRKRSSATKKVAAAGLTGYGVARIGQALYSQAHDFDDTYSVKSGRPDNRSRVSFKEDEDMYRVRKKTKRPSTEELRLERRDSGRRSRRDDRYEEESSKRRDSSSNSSSHGVSRGAALSLGAGAAGAAMGAVATGNRRRSRSRSRSPSRNSKYYHNRVSPMHSYIDLTTTASGPTGFAGFFSSPSANQKKGKKNKGFFNFTNASSSSSDADLAFGEGTVRRKPSREHMRDEKKPRKDNDYGSTAAILGLAATGAALAAESDRRQAKGKERRHADGRTGHSSRHASNGRIGMHDHDTTSDADNDGVWEDASDDDKSADTVDTPLAYRGGSSAQRGRKSSHHYAQTQDETKDKYRRESPPRADGYKFGPVASGIIGAAAEVTAATAISDVSTTMRSSDVLPPMQIIEPKPTNDTPTYGSRRFSQGTGISPRSSVPPAEIIATPGPVPLQQPQPIVPMASVPEKFGQLARDLSAASSPQATIISDVSQINDDDRRTRKRRDSSPAKLPSRENRSTVNFSLTDEQIEAEQRAKDKDERRRLRREEKERRKSADAVTIMSGARSAREEAESPETSRRRRMSEMDSRAIREAEIMAELEKLYEEERKLEMDRRRKEKENKEGVDKSSVAAVAAVVGAGIAAVAATEKEDDSERDSKSRRKSSLKKGKNRDPSSDEETQQERIARMAAQRVRSTPSPVHEDYGTFFVPPELVEHLKEHNEKAEHRDDVDANVVEIIPGQRQKKKQVFDDFLYRPFGSYSDDDPTLYPWPVPVLGLIEPTPPHSRVHSDRGDASPLVSPAKDKFEDVEEDLDRGSGTGSKVSWGEHDTYVYDVETPESERGNFVSDSHESSRSVPEEQTIPPVEEMTPEQREHVAMGKGFENFPSAHEETSQANVSRPRDLSPAAEMTLEDILTGAAAFSPQQFAEPEGIGASFSDIISGPATDIPKTGHGYVEDKELPETPGTEAPDGLSDVRDVVDTETGETDVSPGPRISKSERRRMERAASSNEAIQPKASDSITDPDPYIPGTDSVFDYLVDEDGKTLEESSSKLKRANTLDEIAIETPKSKPRTEYASDPEGWEKSSSAKKSKEKRKSSSKSDVDPGSKAAIAGAAVTAAMLVSAGDDFYGTEKLQQKKSKRDSDIMDDGDTKSTGSSPSDSRKKSKDKKSSGGIFSGFFSSSKSDVSSTSKKSSKSSKSESRADKERLEDGEKKKSRKSKDKSVDDVASFISEPIRKTRRDSIPLAEQQQPWAASPDQSIDDGFVSAEEAVESARRGYSPDEEPFLAGRPDMPQETVMDTPMATDGVSGQMSERELSYATMPALNDEVDTSAAAKSSADEVGVAQNMPRPPEDPLDATMPQTTTPAAPRLSTIRTSDIASSPVLGGSPTAIPLNFRRIPVSPANARGSISSPAASIDSPRLSNRTRQGRPKSTEFRSGKEFRPLYLVERSNNAKVMSPEVEEDLPSLPSSRATSTHPSLEDLRAEAQAQAQAGEEQELVSPERITPEMFRERGRRHSYSYWHDEPQRRISPDYLDSRSATPRPASTQQTDSEKPKRGKPKYEFHSPSELLEDPASHGSASVQQQLPERVGSPLPSVASTELDLDYMSARSGSRSPPPVESPTVDKGKRWSRSESRSRTYSDTVVAAGLGILGGTALGVAASEMLNRETDETSMRRLPQGDAPLGDGPSSIPNHPSADYADEQTREPESERPSTAVHDPMPEESSIREAKADEDFEMQVSSSKKSKKDKKKKRKTLELDEHPLETAERADIPPMAEPSDPLHVEPYRDLSSSRDIDVMQEPTNIQEAVNESTETFPELDKEVEATTTISETPVEDADVWALPAKKSKKDKKKSKAKAEPEPETEPPVTIAEESVEIPAEVKEEEEWALPSSSKKSKKDKKKGKKISLAALDIDKAEEKDESGQHVARDPDEPLTAVPTEVSSTEPSVPVEEIRGLPAELMDANTLPEVSRELPEDFHPTTRDESIPVLEEATNIPLPAVDERDLQASNIDLQNQQESAFVPSSDTVNQPDNDLGAFEEAFERAVRARGLSDSSTREEALDSFLPKRNNAPFVAKGGLTPIGEMSRNTTPGEASPAAQPETEELMAFDTKKSKKGKGKEKKSSRQNSGLRDSIEEEDEEFTVPRQHDTALDQPVAPVESTTAVSDEPSVVPELKRTISENNPFGNDFEIKPEEVITESAHVQPEDSRSLAAEAIVGPPVIADEDMIPASEETPRDVADDYTWATPSKKDKKKKKKGLTSADIDDVVPEEPTREEFQTPAETPQLQAEDDAWAPTSSKKGKKGKKDKKKQSLDWTEDVAVPAAAVGAVATAAAMMVSSDEGRKDIVEEPDSIAAVTAESSTQFQDGGEVLPTIRQHSTEHEATDDPGLGDGEKTNVEITDESAQDPVVEASRDVTEDVQEDFAASTPTSKKGKKSKKKSKSSAFDWDDNTPTAEAEEPTAARELETVAPSEPVGTDIVEPEPTETNEDLAWSTSKKGSKKDKKKRKSLGFDLEESPAPAQNIAETEDNVPPTDDLVDTEEPVSIGEPVIGETPTEVEGLETVREAPEDDWSATPSKKSKKDKKKKKSQVLDLGEPSEPLTETEPVEQTVQESLVHDGPLTTVEGPTISHEPTAIEETEIVEHPTSVEEPAIVAEPVIAEDSIPIDEPVVTEELEAPKDIEEDEWAVTPSKKSKKDKKKKKSKVLDLDEPSTPIREFPDVEPTAPAKEEPVGAEGHDLVTEEPIVAPGYIIPEEPVVVEKSVVADGPAMTEEGETSKEVVEDDWAATPSKKSKKDKKKKKSLIAQPEEGVVPEQEIIEPEVPFQTALTETISQEKSAGEVAEEPKTAETVAEDEWAITPAKQSKKDKKKAKRGKDINLADFDDEPQVSERVETLATVDPIPDDSAKVPETSEVYAQDEQKSGADTVSEEAAAAAEAAPIPLSESDPGTDLVNPPQIHQTKEIGEATASIDPVAEVHDTSDIAIPERIDSINETDIMEVPHTMEHVEAVTGSRSLEPEDVTPQPDIEDDEFGFAQKKKSKKDKKKAKRASTLDNLPVGEASENVEPLPDTREVEDLELLPAQTSLPDMDAIKTSVAEDVNRDRDVVLDPVQSSEARDTTVEAYDIVLESTQEHSFPETDKAVAVEDTKDVSTGMPFEVPTGTPPKTPDEQEEFSWTTGKKSKKDKKKAKKRETLSLDDDQPSAQLKEAVSNEPEPASDFADQATATDITTAALAGTVAATALDELVDTPAETPAKEQEDDFSWQPSTKKSKKDKKKKKSLAWADEEVSTPATQDTGVITLAEARAGEITEGRPATVDEVERHAEFFERSVDEPLPVIDTATSADQSEIHTVRAGDVSLDQTKDVEPVPVIETSTTVVVPTDTPTETTMEATTTIDPSAVDESDEFSWATTSKKSKKDKKKKRASETAVEEPNEGQVDVVHPVQPLSASDDTAVVPVVDYDTNATPVADDDWAVPIKKSKKDKKKKREFDVIVDEPAEVSRDVEFEAAPELEPVAVAAGPSVEETVAEIMPKSQPDTVLSNVEEEWGFSTKKSKKDKKKKKSSGFALDEPTEAIRDVEPEAEILPTTETSTTTEVIPEPEPEPVARAQPPAEVAVDEEEWGFPTKKSKKDKKKKRTSDFAMEEPIETSRDIVPEPEIHEAISDPQPPVEEPVEDEEWAVPSKRSKKDKKTKRASGFDLDDPSQIMNAPEPEPEVIPRDISADGDMVMDTSIEPAEVVSSYEDRGPMLDEVSRTTELETELWEAPIKKTKKDKKKRKSLVGDAAIDEPESASTFPVAQQEAVEQTSIDHDKHVEPGIVGIPEEIPTVAEPVQPETEMTEVQDYVQDTVTTETQVDEPEVSEPVREVETTTEEVNEPEPEEASSGFWGFFSRKGKKDKKRPSAVEQLSSSSAAPVFVAAATALGAAGIPSALQDKSDEKQIDVTDEQAQSKDVSPGEEIEEEINWADDPWGMGSKKTKKKSKKEKPIMEDTVLHPGSRPEIALSETAPPETVAKPHEQDRSMAFGGPVSQPVVESMVVEPSTPAPEEEEWGFSTKKSKKDKKKKGKTFIEEDQTMLEDSPKVDDVVETSTKTDDVTILDSPPKSPPRMEDNIVPVYDKHTTLTEHANTEQPQSEVVTLVDDQPDDFAWTSSKKSKKDKKKKRQSILDDTVVDDGLSASQGLSDAPPLPDQENIEQTREIVTEDLPVAEQGGPSVPTNETRPTITPADVPEAEEFSWETETKKSKKDKKKKRQSAFEEPVIEEALVATPLAEDVSIEPEIDPTPVPIEEPIQGAETEPREMQMEDADEWALPGKKSKKDKKKKRQSTIEEAVIEGPVIDERSITPTPVTESVTEEVGMPPVATPTDETAQQFITETRDAPQEDIDEWATPAKKSKKDKKKKRQSVFEESVQDNTVLPRDESFLAEPEQIVEPILPPNQSTREIGIVSEAVETENADDWAVPSKKSKKDKKKRQSVIIDTALEDDFPAGGSTEPVIREAFDSVIVEEPSILEQSPPATNLQYDDNVQEAVTVPRRAEAGEVDEWALPGKKSKKDKKKKRQSTLQESLEDSPAPGTQLNTESRDLQEEWPIPTEDQPSQIPMETDTLVDNSDQIQTNQPTSDTREFEKIEDWLDTTAQPPVEAVVPQSTIVQEPDETPVVTSRDVAMTEAAAPVIEEEHTPLEESWAVSKKSKKDKKKKKSVPLWDEAIVSSIPQETVRDSTTFETDRSIPPADTETAHNREMQEVETLPTSSIIPVLAANNYPAPIPQSSDVLPLPESSVDQFEMSRDVALEDQPQTSTAFPSVEVEPMDWTPGRSKSKKNKKDKKGKKISIYEDEDVITRPDIVVAEEPVPRAIADSSLLVETDIVTRADGDSGSDVSASMRERRKRRRSPPIWAGEEPADLSRDRALTPPPDHDDIMDTALGVAAGLGFGGSNQERPSLSQAIPAEASSQSMPSQDVPSWNFGGIRPARSFKTEANRDSGIQFADSPTLGTGYNTSVRDSGYIPSPAVGYNWQDPSAQVGDHSDSNLRPPRPRSPTSSAEEVPTVQKYSDSRSRRLSNGPRFDPSSQDMYTGTRDVPETPMKRQPSPVMSTSKDRSSALFDSSPAIEMSRGLDTSNALQTPTDLRRTPSIHGHRGSRDDLRSPSEGSQPRRLSDTLSSSLLHRTVAAEVDKSAFSPLSEPIAEGSFSPPKSPLHTIPEHGQHQPSNDFANAAAIAAAGIGGAALLASTSRDHDAKTLGEDQSRTSPLRNVRASSTTPYDPRDIAPSPTRELVNEGGVESAVSRGRGMADVYDGYGVHPGSPRSPTRPQSIRRRQSMQQIRDLEARVDQLANENRSLAEAKITAERHLEEFHLDRTRTEYASEEALQTATLQLRERDEEILKLREEIATLAATHESLRGEHEQRYSSLEDQHNQAQSQWQESTRELDTLRSQHEELSTGMEDIVRHEIENALAEKNAEVERLYRDLELAKGKIRELQSQILARGRDEVIVGRDEDYFDSACQQLCQHVQQWVLRFSKFSDTRLCRTTNEVRDDKIVDRFDNAILDGTDVDIYLGDRIKRRDVFMSVVMTMIWEYVFTRYLFGMDRDQRQKLKQLEKNLSEVGSQSAVRQWRALTLTLLAKREAFKQQRENDTEAVAVEIFMTLSRFLPPPGNLEGQIQESLRNVMRAAVDLSIEMRTQKAEYIMLPPLQPEYDTNGDLARKVYFNASLMNERSGETTSNDELEAAQAVVRMVLFPLVVKKGDDQGHGDEEIVVCPAQVLVARQDKGKRARHSSGRVPSGASAESKSLRAASTHSLAMSGVDTGNGNMI